MEQTQSGSGIGGGASSAIFSFMQSFMDRSDMTTPTATATPTATPPLTSGSQSPLLTAPSAGVSVADGAVSLSPLLSSVRLLQPNCENPSEQQKRMEQSRLDYKSEEYRQLFHLPAEEVLVEDFNCALQKKILLQGHMYLFERYVCFYSNIFGYEKKKVIPLKDVTCVRKAKTAQVFPNAIEITTWGKKHFFASFLSRDEAYRLIVNGWARHSAHAHVYLGSPNMSPRPSVPLRSEGSSAPRADFQSPLRPTAADGGFGSRDITEVPRSPVPSVGDEDAEKASSQGLADRADTEGSLEGALDESGPHANPTTVADDLWQPSAEEAPELPNVYRTVVESEFPIGVRDFFHLFLSNDAVGFIKMVHTKCGDEEFHCTQWSKHRHLGHARDISFRYPINFVFGPKATYCHETQRFRVYHNSHLVLDSAQQMADIPYGDYFHVQVRWDVQRLVGSGTTGCFLRISLHVPFSKKTIMKSRIEQGTFDGCKEAFSTWIREAHGLLQEPQARTILGTSEILMPTVTTELLSKPFPGFKLTSDRLPGFEVPSTKLLTHRAKQRKTLSEADQELQGRNGIQHHDHPSTSGSIQPINIEAPRLPGSRLKRPCGFETGCETEAELPTEIRRQRMGFLQRMWTDWCPSNLKTWNQLKFVMVFIVLILLLQVCIMVVLARPRGVQYVSVDYRSSVQGPFSGINPGVGSSCVSGDDSMSWLEQRARFLKEEVAMAEARLQTLFQDLGKLKMQLHFFQKLNPQFDVDPSA